MGYIKVETNVPIVGVLNYCDYADGQYGRQIKLKGKWDGTADDTVYLPDTAYEKLRGLGVAEETDQLDQKTNQPKIKVNGKPRLRIVRKEDGKQKYYEINKEGGGASPSENGASGQSSRPAAGAGAPADGNGQAGKFSPASHFRRLLATMTGCLKYAREECKNEPAMIQPVANTIFIQACRDGALYPDPKKAADAPPPTPITESQKGRIDLLGQELGWGIAQLEAHIRDATKNTDPYKLTEAQASAAIKSLEAAVDEQKRLAAIEAQKKQQDPAPPQHDEEEIPF